jgi:hypothetical protein
MATLTYSTHHGQASRPAKLWLHWTSATALGELIGFGVPAFVGAIAGSFELAQGAMFVVLVLAGAIEGAILGLAQWLALRRYLPGVRRRDWVIATALAATVAWIIGMLPSTFESMATLAPVLLSVGATVLGGVFLLSIGGAQWFVLRHHVQQAGWWIVANAVAWPLGIAVPVVALSLAPDGTPLVIMIALGVVSGLLMGLVVGAVTGLALVLLLRNRLGQ